MKTKTNFPPEFPYNKPKEHNSPPKEPDIDDVPNVDQPKPKKGPNDVPEQLQ